MASRLSRLFAARVLEEAAKRGMSINRLADFSGLSRGYLSELLRGKKTPTLDTVEQLAGALEVDAWRLLRDR